MLGCHALIEPGDGPALIFDIGGGSTELVLIDTSGPVPRVLDWHSAPWGVVSLTEHAGGGEGRGGAARRLCADARARRRQLRRVRRAPAAATSARRGCSAPAAR